MLPADLNSDRFSGYPPRARQAALDNLPLLRSLPLAFVPLLLRELAVFDWGFPAERRELEAQFAYLHGLSAENLGSLMAPFRRLLLTSELESADWVAAPARFSERLTAHLWATGQIEAFRAAAEDYMARVGAAAPADAPPIPRLAIIVLGRDVTTNQYTLFRRLRPHGAYYRRVDPQHGWPAIQQAVATRAKDHPIPYGHWYIEGGQESGPSSAGQKSGDTPDEPHGEASPASATGVSPGFLPTTVSWSGLAHVRAELLARVRKAKLAGTGSEALRTLLAEMDPRDLGLPSDGPLARFQTALLTEGSGTQIYSTTFVQWAAREALRRAQPVTLLARFAPRIRELSLGELLSNPHQQPPPDPLGALIDADMAAYYTWIGQHRLSGASQARFLVWFEDHAEALAIAPSLRPATVSDEPIGIPELLARVGA